MREVLTGSALQNVLCVRVDNMGDMLMSTPAFRALKETFDCKITVLTSAMGSLITPYINEIDETIVADVPWVRTAHSIDEVSLARLVQTLAARAFDAAIIFTVYSQNPLPAALLLMMAGIDIRVAFCRENPYSLLSHWLPDEEPYTLIQHQVQRDLQLVAALGAFPKSQTLSVSFSSMEKTAALQKLNELGVDGTKPFILFHPGVSEEKRKYPQDLWIEAGKICSTRGFPPIVITGSSSEKSLAAAIQNGIGKSCVSTAGMLTIGELLAVIGCASVVVSVNTGTVHMAAALQKPVVVLYALTNPQHTPWKTPNNVLYFSVPQHLKSKNEVVNFVIEKGMQQNVPLPSAAEVCSAISQLLAEKESG